MPSDRKSLNRRRIQILFGVLLACILYAEFKLHGGYEPIIRKGEVVLASVPARADRFESLVRESPLEALTESRDQLDREARDYGCTFVKQERLSDDMGAEQEIEVLFRPDPYSVMMNWTRNAKLSQRVIYVKGKWIDEGASKPEYRELAVVQPLKVFTMIVGDSMKQPINGFFAQRSSRRSIDEFGFKRALDLLIKYCDLARSRDELELAFKGESHFDGRPVWVIRRHLPYTGEDGIYPDRVAEIYLDKEYRVPVAVYCYDRDRALPEDLLGKYEYRNVRFGLGLTEKDFEPATYGL